MNNPFLRLMTQALILEHKAGVDQYGAPMFAVAVSVACRWRAEPTRVQTATGVAIVGTDVVWVPPGTGMKADDRVTLPSGRTVLVRIVVEAPGPHGEIYAQRGTCL